MRKKSLAALAKEYEVEDFIGYIIQSMEWGQFSQIPGLLNEMKKEDVRHFLNDVSSGKLDFQLGDHKQKIIDCITAAL